MPEDGDRRSVERVIAAAPEAIFALLVDPRRHRDIDGSGSVRDPKGDPETLTLGSTFGMAMKAGMPYSMQSTVIEFDDNRLIAWQTRGSTSLGKYFGGRIWRYELEPVEGGTRVRETWDISQESSLTKWLVRGAGAHTVKNMEATLARIDDLVAS